jgi:hypothetical protein
MAECRTGGVDDQPRAELPRQARHACIEVVGHPGRQTAARDGERRPGIECPELVQAALHLFSGQLGPRQHKPELPAGRGLVDSEALSRHVPDRNHALMSDARLVEKVLERASRRSPGRVNGRRLAAQDVDDPGNVDAATTRVTPRCLAAQLVRRHDPLGRGRDVERGVHGQRRDR